MSQHSVTISSRWSSLYNQVPLCDVPRHYAGMNNSPFLLEYLQTVLSYCPRGGRALETGVGSGYGAIWLSKRGVVSEGLDISPELVERARQINAILEGKARFRTGDLFEFDNRDDKVHVIYHQGVLEHFTVPQIRAALARQVVSAGHVVFSVPSVYYPFPPEFGDERLLTLAAWQRILEPFAVVELKYYGDPQHGAQEHVLAVLKGQEVTPELEALMTVPAEPFPNGITAIVHTRNEERHIEQCLQTLQGWTDEIIVCDMESSDATVEIARRFTDNIIAHPHIAHFDRARNVSAMHANYRWVFYLDADERVPPALGQALRTIAQNPDTDFDGLLIPFRHHFAGHWMRSLYPGYTMPRLFRNGKFHFSARHHAGPQVEGKVACFPADNPELALVHYSYDSLSHYLNKLNNYTDGEAQSLHRDGQPFHWKNAVRHFVRDFASYYDAGQAAQDGVHGFLYSFLSGFYRFEQHAKLFERRYHNQQLTPGENAVPSNTEEMLEYALQVLREKPMAAAPTIQVTEGSETKAVPDVVWSGPLLDPSGYGEESRQFVLGLDEAGTQVSAQILPWSHDEVSQSTEQKERLQQLATQPVAPGFVQIVQNFPPSFERHPQAGLCIGRTMFETDRLPADWVKACNKMDAIWVPSLFNRQTFIDAGVQAEKLAVVPGCFDPTPYLETNEERGARSYSVEKPFTFLSVFDWTLHKGWDVLLQGFLEVFEGRDDVALILKVWSTMGYSAQAIRQQAAQFVQEKLGIDLAQDTRIRFVQQHLSDEELRELYQEADAFVLPSRGEGWGRPYMEAMASGLPTIGTHWSGNTAFMNGENSFLIDCTVQAVPETGWREIPTYRGHRWAEPDLGHLKQLMQQLVEQPQQALEVAKRGRAHVIANFDRKVVAKQIEQAIDAAVKARQQPEEAQVTDRTPVRWEGAQFNYHSLGYVNRELCGQLVESDAIELAITPTEPSVFTAEDEPRLAPLQERFFAPLSQEAKVHVRHFFPPRLNRPDEGHFALIQPWEYGYLPKDWIAPIQQNVDEVWCYSKYVRDVYRNSGINEGKLHVVPLGVDTTIFRPEAPPYIFTTEPGAHRLQEKTKEKPFTFLFTGGTLQRKGIDVLLEAYRMAFTPLDDVCLIIKDTGVDTVYRGQNERERIIHLAQDASHPAMVYLQDDLSEHQLAGVYTAADCLVQPYRGEGFCLPALEAMACGVPVIVPAGGPTDDFVDEQVGWRIEAEHKPREEPTIGEWECVGHPWMFEVSPQELAKLMRQVFNEREEAQRRGQAALERVQAQWTWQHAGKVLRERIEALASKPLAQAGKVEVRDSTQQSLPSKREKPTISLCMIVRDEERVLGDCLQSIKPYVDEMIVVDTGSTDRTVEIAREHGAKLFEFPWCHDFSAARNESLKHATGDWILWIDADDTIPPECGEGLAKLAAQAEDSLTGFLMQVHIPPAPGEEGFTIVDHVKLFRNHLGLQFEGRIHEQILEPIHRIGGRVERSNLYVVHSGYDYSPAGQTKKRERDLLLLQKDLEERPGHPFVLFNIGMTAHHLKEWDKAINALQECLARCKPRESIVRKAYAMLAGSYLSKGDCHKAVEQIEKGLQLFPHDPELLFRAGIVYREAGKLPQAEHSYIKLLTHRETGHIDSLDVTMTGFKAHHNLALIYQDMGRLPEAEAQFRSALNANPGFGPSQAGLQHVLQQQKELCAV